MTAIEFQLYEISEVYAGWLYFPLDRAGEVLHAWREWTQTAPEEATSVAKLVQFPPFEEIPEVIRGKSFAAIEVAFLGSEAEGIELLKPLRELGPQMDTFDMVGPEAIPYLHLDPPEPVPGHTGGHHMLNELTAETVDELVEMMVPAIGDPLLMFEIRHLGGALARGGESHGALDRIEGDYMTFGCGIVMGPGAVEAIEASLAPVAGVLAPHSAGRQYFNFVEGPSDASGFYGEETFRRLQSVRAKYDALRLFQANHEIAPA